LVVLEINLQGNSGDHLCNNYEYKREDQLDQTLLISVNAEYSSMNSFEDIPESWLSQPVNEVGRKESVLAIEVNGNNANRNHQPFQLSLLFLSLEVDFVI